MDPVSETFICLATLIVEIHQCKILIDWENYNFNILSDTTEQAVICAENIEILTKRVFNKEITHIVLSES